MNKIQTIQFLQDDHKKLETIISGLKKEQLTDHAILGTWTTKDIIAHISAWNKEIHKAIDIVLNNEKPWYIDEIEDKFNEKEIEIRKNWSINQIVEEWQVSFNRLIHRIKIITSSEWNYQTDFTWPGGGSVSIKSLFGYRYQGEGHEGGHAKQIEEFFKTR